jgi:hypothetical protein
MLFIDLTLVFHKHHDPKGINMLPELHTVKNMPELQNEGVYKY